LTQKRFPKKGKRTWQIKERKKVRKKKTQKSKSSRPYWNEKK